MRRSVIWFVLSAFWGLDCVLASIHHNGLQAALTAFFALCFLAIGLFFQKRDRRNRMKTARTNNQVGWPRSRF
jgi:hypothetical protein